MGSMSVDAARYTYRVSWSAQDDQFVATCVEFPSLSWLATTPEEALGGLCPLVGDVVAEMSESGEDLPEPLS